MAFKAHFLSVGCADCTIFEMDNDLVMVDAGYRRFPNGVSKPTNIRSYMRDVIGKAYIDLLIVSHAHHDHYLGFEDLIGYATVARFWGSPYQRRYGDNSLSLDDWNEYCALRDRLVPDASRRSTPYKDEAIAFSGCTYRVVGPRSNVNASDTRECHDACLVTWANTPANNFIVCGDASDSELDQIRRDWNLSSCSVLRASHHGSVNGADLEFIKACSPRDTVISTKSGIFDNVPSPVALQRYQAHSQKVLRTDVNGTCTTPLR
jgi:beta-lactamase superfamily II metal-dependent hydrolase